MASTPTVIFGGSAFGPREDPIAKFHTSEEAQAALNIFRRYGHNRIDIARNYSSHAPETAEPLQAQTDAGSWAITDTTIRYTGPGSHSKENISKSVQQSLDALKVESVNTVYLHAPDPQTSPEEICRVMNEEYKGRKFKHFGISNHSPEVVERMAQFCKEQDLNLPTVYQGHYNAIARLAEERLIPTLRAHGIAFYAYSPGASGIFCGKARKGQGRFGDHRVGQLYSESELYYKDEIVESAQKVHDLAAKHGISGHAVALRWILHHSKLDGSKGDAIIVGAANNEQLQENLKICG